MQPMQQTIKPDSEDSSLSSSSSSSSESSDEEVPLKEKMKEFPFFCHSRRETDLDLHSIPGVKTQSFNLDHIPQNKRGVDEVGQNLQEEMIDLNINHDPRVVHTQGPKDFHVRGENLHPAPQTDVLDWGQGPCLDLDPVVGAGIPSIQTVTPLWGSNHLITVNDPTHPTTSNRSIHIPVTQGKGTSWIKSKTQFDRAWRANPIVRLVLHSNILLCCLAHC